MSHAADDAVTYSLRARLDKARTDAKQLAKDLDRWQHETAASRAYGQVCGCQGCILVAGIVPEPGQAPAHAAHPAVMLAGLDAQRLLLAEVERRRAESDEHSREVEKLSDALQVMHAQQIRTEDERERLRAQREKALEVARWGYHDASRWEHPLDVPQWVRALFTVLDAPDDRCLCVPCSGADERRARDRGEAGLA